MRIDREIGNINGESEDIINLGVIYDYLGQPKKAIEYYQEALT
ncbi:tetratricopeptide repeat protein [Desulfococcaceae bacterium HSG9]|nr:tetratricopeptide repeat protein [Desulfococcaceae bacterium HSG9]